MEDKKEATQEEKKEVATKNEHVNMVADFEHGIYGSSDSFKMAYQMAKALSQSTIVPAHFQRNEANCLVAISQAQKLDIDPFTVMQNMYMIQGKISWSSSFLIAMINASGKYDMELQFDEEEKDGKPYSCKCWTEKDGRKVDGVKVTMDMADDEGWTKKNGSKEELIDNDFSEKKTEKQANLNDLLKEDDSDSIDVDAVIIENAEEE